VGGELITKVGAALLSAGRGDDTREFIFFLIAISTF